MAAFLRFRPARALAAALGVLTLVLTAPFAAAESFQAAPPAAGDPVVFIGVAGLAWSDITPEHTPALWETAGGAVGSLSVRSVRRVACPLDGWLAVNSSARAAGTSAACDVLYDPENGRIELWPEITAALAEQNYGARLGTLSANLAAAPGTSALAIGPGAGIALADEHGRVENYEVREQASNGLAEQVESALAAHDLLVIDAGVMHGPENRAEQLELIEERIEAIRTGIAGAPGAATVILASLADDGEPATRPLMIPTSHHGVITSPSTRQPGYAQVTDLQATILDALHIEGESAGAAVRVAPSSASTPALVAAELDRELKSLVLQPPIVPTFFTLMVVLNVALYAAVAIGLKRPTLSRKKALLTLRAVALAVASIPVASYLANVVPWWRSESPASTLTLAITGAIAALVALSLAGPWRRRPLGPPTVIAGVLAVVLGVDVALGSPLQISTVMGSPPVVGGRWYGMTNIGFSQFATAMILLAIAAAQPFMRRGHRRMAALMLVGFGALTAFIDGAPFLGADFGGPPAILPAFLILALLAAGVRITVKRVGLVALGTFLIVSAIAFIDWLRPPAARSHIGNFFQQVLDGELFLVIVRKLDANLRVLMGNRPLTILALSAVALVVFVLARPIRSEITDPKGGRFGWLSQGTPITAMTKDSPLLGHALVAAAILAGLGMALNDSGIAIPANVAAVLVPSLIAATATWMLTLEPDSGGTSA